MNPSSTSFPRWMVTRIQSPNPSRSLRRVGLWDANLSTPSRPRATCASGQGRPEPVNSKKAFQDSRGQNERGSGREARTQRDPRPQTSLADARAPQTEAQRGCRGPLSAQPHCRPHLEMGFTKAACRSARGDKKATQQKTSVRKSKTNWPIEKPHSTDLVRRISHPQPGLRRAYPPHKRTKHACVSPTHKRPPSLPCGSMSIASSARLAPGLTAASSARASEGPTCHAAPGRNDRRELGGVGW